MYELDPSWMDYFTETDPKKRARILETKEEGETRTIAEHLCALRFEKDADRFLRCLVELEVLSNAFTTGRGAEKAIRKDLSLLTLDGKTEHSEEEKTLLYWEIRNTTLRYLESTKSDDYARKYCGLVRASDDEKKQRAAQDILSMTEGIRSKIAKSRNADLAADLDFYIDAVQDAYKSSDEDASVRLDRMMGKKIR